MVCSILRLVCRFLCVGIAGTSLTPFAVAQEQAPPADYVPPKSIEDVVPSNPAIATMPSTLISWLREGVREADYVEGLMRYSQEHDRAGDGLDKGDINEQIEIQVARLRAEYLSRLMANDLDGDGFVTGEEAMRVAATRLSQSRLDEKYKSQQVMQAYTEVLRYDDDGDRKVTVAEYLKRTRHHIQVSGDELYLDMLDLDPNRDGHLTAEEIEDIAHRAFRVVDTDIDGIISRDESSNAKGPRQMAELDERIGPCRMTPPRPEDLFVHLYIYAAKWQPDVTIAGQYGETKLARVRIEPGEQPLYIVLSSYNPTIWQFEGAVERLAHVTVSPGYLVGAGEDVPGGGTIGVAADRVEFLRPGSCLVSYKSDSSMGDEGTVGRAFMRGAGRRPDKSINPYGFENFLVPSGAIIEDSTYKPSASYEDKPGEQLREQEDFSADPDEVVSIDPVSVLAPGLVERYVVLPTYYGLRQLVGEGKLERTNEGYKIIRPITHFPANVDGQRFILPEGIEIPTGQWMYPIITEQRFID